MSNLADVQSQKDERNIPIDKVGVKNLTYPITLLDKTKQHQHTIAKINMYVLLPSDFKGTHMSRFIEILNENRECIDIRKIGKILREMRERLNAKKSYIELNFPYFIEKAAPITGIKSLMSYECEVKACGDENNNEEITLTVKVPITSLCPCSKEISDYGAHNQRGIAKISAILKEFVWIEDLINVAESSASCDIYSLLKRPDEKYVTEKAYNNPMFVEDIARNITQKLLQDKRISHFEIEVENFESIHNHNAYAFISR
ncbi:GTP cyclohydrolase FolE2 [Hippea alviniae]|uniref:GTP cyclohydrolase FolE2 n=1 Tax=Hippea alviniae TaxID=1279027 RepID=UPI0003B33239|nr:GTP cyclohydrolase FolE2 [Hippea alviniae]